MLHGVKYAIALLFAGLCVYASLRDSPYLVELPFMPKGVGRWLDVHENTRHLWGYAVLTLLTGWAFLGGRTPVAWRNLVLSLSGLAILLEALQIFLPHRRADVWDVVWSLLGAAFGGLLGAAFARMTGEREDIP